VLPADQPRPRGTCEEFFEPFVHFGFSLYDVYAEELIGSTPSSERYLEVLNFNLKTMVCDRIAPWREKPIRTLRDRLEAAQRGDPQDEWSVRMGESWQQFEHPRHLELDQRVLREFVDLSNVWSPLVDRLHVAISKRVLPWLAEHAEFAEGRTEGDNPSAAPTITKPQEWEDIEFSFIGDHDAEIRVAGARARKVNYKEIVGFEDRRTGLPSQQWAILRAFGRLSDGVLRYDARAGKEWMATQKKIERTSKALRNHFGLTGDPLPYFPGTGYRARIKFKPSSDNPH
jgi:hypothetical protein